MANEDLRFLIRRKEEVAIYTSPNDPKKLTTVFEGECTQVEISENGEFICGVDKEAVIVFHLPTSTQTLTLSLKEVLYVGFSKRGNYLVTCQRPNKQLKGEHKNIQIWELATGDCLWSVHRQNVNDDSWPLLQWSADESSVFFSVINTVHVYSPRDNFKSVMRKLPVKGISSFSVSPGCNLKLASYVPEAKGAPATIAIYPFSGFPKRHEDSPVITNRKSFYRVSGVHFLWNSTGTALLCSSFSDVDVTNQSYYGEQQLHFLEGDNEVSCVVPNLPKGPIHDVQWSPLGDHFAVVAGFMPAKTLLFDSKSNAIFDLGSGAFNFVRFNPFGRILCIAGFGNLPGDIVFYEKKKNGVCKKLNSIRSPSVSLEWSPCGRQVLTAITAPRLRVDNKFKILNYYGETLATEDIPVLFETRWIPVIEGKFTDRPLSPRKTQSILQKSNAEEADSVYIPPHLRGKSGHKPSSISFSLGHSEDSGGRIKKEQNQSSIPGSMFVSKSAAKNARRRAKKREQKEPTVEVESSYTTIEEPVKEGEKEEEEEEVVEGVSLSKDETEKKIRSLKKKLKQIRQLKEKLAKGGNLEVEQMEKVNTEKDILEELEAYESHSKTLM